MRNINIIMSEYAQYKRISDETNGILDALKSEMRDFLRANNIRDFNGDEHKIKVIAKANSYINFDLVKAFLPDIDKKDISTRTEYEYLKFD